MPRLAAFAGMLLAAGMAGPAQVRAQVHAVGPPVLSLPLACEPHRTCFIQSYVDLDAGTGVRDYACGGATYDGHSGVDFRLLSAEATKAGVPVLASADGVVKGVRDGVTDIFASQGKPEDVKGRECGNGVVIDHGDGWETQYCHLKQNSISVFQGQSVTRGERLGDVGFSGLADFPHVHLSVRHDGKVVDPFLPDATACQRDAKGTGMWEPAAARAFPYKNGEIIAAGFSGEVVDKAALDADHGRVTPVTPTSPALVFYGHFINLRAGDRIRIVVTGPGGSLVEQLSEPLDRDKARWLSFAGKKRKDNPWPFGRYEGRAEIVRDSAVVGASVAVLDLR